MPSVSAPAAGPRTRTDLDDLQGVWASVAGPRDARLVVVGGRFTFEFVGGGDIFMGTLALDPTAGPARMDMRVEEGPAKYKGQLVRCIYHLDGDILRWCPARPGADACLTCFPSVDDGRYLCTVFRHDRPRRRA